ncbi:MAG: beta-propeller domain-containing protein [Rhizomicrobium sp.]
MALLAVGLSGIAFAAQAAGALTAFSSEAQLQGYLKRLKRPLPPPPPPPPAPPAPGSAIESVMVATAPGSITNNQETGVDEGDIVKQHGDTLVILRRGRLFTVSLAGGAMKPVDSIDAYPPGLDARGDWYDEMLIAKDRIVVIGYSYERGGTQINRFHIDPAGHLAFEDAYQLRSNDYYSSRNYASRMIGTRLILYSPHYLPYDESQSLSVVLPALRRWNGKGAAPSFERIGTAHEIYLPPTLPIDLIEAMHTVVSCDTAAPVLRCKATGVFGPANRTFYVSTDAVYVWLSPWWGDEKQDGRAGSLLYRLPLDGGAPRAARVRGAPVDQFAFRQDGAMLNVLVREDGRGDWMWAPEHSRGAVALLRLPLSLFGDGGEAVSERHYRGLPASRGGYDFHDRFVGDYVLYGEGNGWGTPASFDTTVIAAPLRGGEAAALTLPHGVDRIEAMGGDAVVIGGDDKNVYFSAVALGGQAPVLGDRYVLKAAAQGETRSHGFFFKPEGDRGDGVLGLPVTTAADPAYRQLTDSSAAMLFLRRSGGKFVGLGELTASLKGVADDACVASCTDWYGNARPIFLGDRTFALMGYEIVEGAIGRGDVRETGRAVFAPAPKPMPVR